MIKELNINIINQNCGLVCTHFELSDFSQVNTKKANSYGLAFLFGRNLGSIQPKTSLSDCIENKPTLGGEPMSLSMYNNTLPFIQFSACNAQPATGDLNFNGNAKTISREDCLYYLNGRDRI